MQLLEYQVVAFLFLATFLDETIFWLSPLKRFVAMKPFKLARLYDAGGDITQSRFIYF